MQHAADCTSRGLWFPAVLLGPLRALDYFFSHGLLAVVLGAMWHQKSHWSLSLAAGAATRLVGLLGYFNITAWILKEDLFSLMLSNVYSLLVRYTTNLLNNALVASIQRCHQLLSLCRMQPVSLLALRPAICFGLL